MAFGGALPELKAGVAEMKRKYYESLVYFQQAVAFKAFIYLMIYLFDQTLSLLPLVVGHSEEGSSVKAVPDA